MFLRALILSTTSVAFVGMHFVVSILEQARQKEEKVVIAGREFGLIGALIINATLLFVMLLLYHDRFEMP